MKNNEMNKYNEVEIQNEVQQMAILVGVTFGRHNEYDLDESMNELAELTKAAGAEVVGMITQERKSVEPATYIGKGKVEEVLEFCQNTDANLVIFNDELSGSQIRNLEKVLNVAVIDRTTLILDIFALRARTKIAKLQVELAQLKYKLPRLSGQGTSLSKTGAGIGTRGPGEQKLELDRRRIKSRMADIRSEIRDAEKNKTVQKARREKNAMPVVALVGYTNAGKSTLMNKMIEKSYDEVEDRDVFVKDMLFATLDTYNRRIVLEDKKEFILTDTVGFVSKLPHALVDAFKSTLDEALDADLIIHVVDISNENYEMQISVTKDVLTELNAHTKSEIIVLNKHDLLEEDEFVSKYPEAVKISAKTGSNLDVLIAELKQALFSDYINAKFIIPYDQGHALSYLCDTYDIKNMDYLEKGTYFETDVIEADFNKYKQYILD